MNETIEDDDEVETIEDDDEVITCIAKQDFHPPLFTWCGKSIFGFHFRSIDHAAVHRAEGGRLLVCRECAAKVIAALQSA